MRRGDIIAALRRLYEAEVQFIIVGDLAAVLNGAPIGTFDWEVLYSYAPANVDRIVRCLGHPDLSKRFGPLSLLGAIGGGLGYEELLPQSGEMDVGQGVHVRVLNLEATISLMQQSASDKDLALLPTLRNTLDEIRKQQATS